MAKIAFALVSLLFHFQSFGADVKGRVLDSRTAEPVVGATVSLGGRTWATQTGLDGTFLLKGVPDGKYTLSVTMTAYGTLTQSLTLNPGAPATDLNLQLQPVSRDMTAVMVMGRTSGATDAGARQLEKASDNVINILSTHQLQLMPDLTVASVLRRVSGVTVDRGSNGEGRYPVIRGMDKRYNYTLINGIKIPSPDDKNRYVPMDLFPSEMLQRLEVIKSLTPDMEGDAIGGVMNLVMRDPPEKLQVSAQGALGYSQMLLNQPFTGYDHSAVNQKSPGEIHGSDYVPSYSDFSTGNLTFTNQHPLPDGQFGLTIGNRYFHQRLGIILSGSNQSTDRITKDLFFALSPQPNPVLYGTEPDMTDEQHRTYSTHEDRLGAHAKLDYRLGERSRLSLYMVYIRLNSYESRMITDSGTTFRTGPGAGQVGYASRSRTDLQSIYNSTLQGQHALGDHFTIDWSAVYSHASQKMPDRAELSLSQVFYLDSTGKPEPKNVPILAGLQRIWQHNSDQDIAGYLNAHYTFKIGAQSFDLGAGAMARHKERSNYYNEYDFNYPSNTPFTNIADAPFTPKNSGTPQSPNTYDATEDISAGYGEIRWKPNSRWNVLAGIRFENTHQTYDQVELPITQPAKSGTVTYLDPLPSVQVKYTLNEQSALHLAYFSSISRPGFFEIVPYDFPGEYYDEVGNYNLKHAKANNVDLRYELFPGHASQFLLGAFYKRIQDPIEYVYARPATSLSVIEPENVGTATNVGAEVVFTHYWKKIGVSANYTYTHSNIPTVYKFYYAVPGGVTSTSIIMNRPLQGQAAHIGNVSLIYKEPASGLELQLSGIYTGRHITYLSQYGAPDTSMDYWQRGAMIVDFSGEKSLGKHFALYVKLGNLLNTPDVIEMNFPPTAYIKQIFPDAAGRSDRTLVEKKYFGQTYLFGIRYRL